MSLFDKRENILPYEYPELLDYMKAIQQSYWLVDEFNYDGDKQNYLADLKEIPFQKNLIKKAMLAISQIEVNVKTFWGRLDMLFPKLEISLVGATFSDSEGRHFEAYKRLLEILGLNEEFTRIHEIPALQKRVDYTTKFVENKALNNEETILSVVLFSMFIEHISLFSQFLILMSFNKYRNMFRGISNAVEATSKEEEIHGKFGIALYEILRRERPELFTEAFFNRLESMADEAFEAEMTIVDWMYESETNEDLDFLPKRVVINYIKNRYNRSYKALGLEPKYVVDQDDYKYVEWFDIEVVAIKENDFFNKRNVDYAKGTQGQTGDDLF